MPYIISNLHQDTSKHKKTYFNNTGPALEGTL